MLPFRRQISWDKTMLVYAYSALSTHRQLSQDMRRLTLEEYGCTRVRRHAQCVEVGDNLRS